MSAILKILVKFFEAKNFVIKKNLRLSRVLVCHGPNHTRVSEAVFNYTNCTTYIEPYS